MRMNLISLVGIKLGCLCELFRWTQTGQSSPVTKVIHVSHKGIGINTLWLVVINGLLHQNPIFLTTHSTFIYSALPFLAGKSRC